MISPDFTANDVEYGGYCMCCGKPMRDGEEAYPALNEEECCSEKCAAELNEDLED